MGIKSPKRLQISTPYGEFELNADGRPDDSPSMLERYSTELARHQRARNGGEPFGLDEDAVQALGQEALLYRIRREYFFQHDDHARSRRDVLHGINIIEFIHKYALDPEQQKYYWQFRADQEIFLRVAEANLRIQGKDYAGARRQIENASTFITDFYGGWDSTEAEEAHAERRKFLREKFHEIGHAWENDPGPLANSAPALDVQMAEAIAAENYERAAELRDQIRAQNAPAR